ncbi:type IV pilus assembly protein PilL [Geotalea daltonii FRC-32]|uniref:Type IV pilus assembly protein PilL n=1 Tax=Geotalea daltonii (strain DSM 22248 / JCM 15807 / FRC-32) TaxID=316067 RepID=B9M3K0_GEODF|nr:hypothetical protein [Geotalea daltonii]ACM21421.1 type IV pilus assembly protein PilL [Geotalea daltonii FRC-32]
MKKIILLIFFLMLMCWSVVEAAQQSVLTYFNGIVGDIQGDTITVANTTFVLDKRVIVHIHQRKKGALYEVAGKLTDIHVGSPVYLRIAGRKVFEITLERWKQ